MTSIFAFSLPIPISSPLISHSAKLTIPSSRKRYVAKCRIDSNPESLRTCVRCKKRFLTSENAPRSCLFHGDIQGNVMNLNLYEDHHFDDPALSEVKGPRYGKRWACCQDTDENAPPCKSGYHVTYDCDKSRWTEGIEFAVR